MSFGRDWLRCCRRSRISTSPAKQAVGEDALAALHEVGADVILLDLEMPGLDGIQTLGAMDEAGMTTPVIVFTVFDTDDRIVDAVQAGARGYLLKSAPRRRSESRGSDGARAESLEDSGHGSAEQGDR